MEDRSWEQGLHQLIETKEGCELTGERETLARISYQRFFRRYLRLAGMTGTAREVARELWSAYGLRVVTVPTNRPLHRVRRADRIFAAADAKWDAVVDTIDRMHRSGRSVLVGTRSVAASEHLSGLLTAANLPHDVLNARQDDEEARIIAQAGQRGRITVATNMAGRGTDIQLAPEVAELGGLHVIATERHDARRIDRQLFGRCGRQGDPGTYEMIASLEDELARLYGGPGAGKLAGRCLRHRWPLAGWAGRRTLRRAQRRAEALHGRMRRDLLKMDKQLGTALAFSGRSE
jgi:preprotein translocase subunit SecA